MFRFSCFHANVQGNKAKKTDQPSTEAMVKALQDVSQNKGCKDSSNPPSEYSSPSKEQAHKQINVIENHISNWDSVERRCRSEDLNSKFSSENDSRIHQTRCLKKSQSLQSGLDQVIGEGDEDLGLSCDGAKSQNESSRKYRDANPIDEYGNSPNIEFQVSSRLANDGSLFSIGDPTPSDKDAREISDTLLSGEFACDIPDQSSVPVTLSLRKSRSLPNSRASMLSSKKDAFKCALSRSSDDLHALRMRQKEEFINDFFDQIRGDQERENDMGKNEDGHMDSFFDDGFDSYLLSGSAKDWVMPITDDTTDVKTLQGGSSVDCAGEVPNKDFKIKRIEDWVIGLQHCGPPLEETNEELPEVTKPLVDVSTVNGVTAASVDHKVTPGMEAAKRYISSLGANATAAQLANHGLVVIPFLSAFVSLKVLNLAGNTIVRITAGALPRGLHALNLSRNKISIIEGLRELTRLRVLDLSYNRILRIGHGLASCSSLKELYLAGNKISDVEGLHRLLKLSILDLRFNKISTAKCLGQLAANYNSLQAINLDGNPAQKNVGDEQMKKYLQGLLPHLVFYNRQPMKVSTLKDGGAERSVRLGTNSHQFDRSLRADRKTTRKGSQGVVATRRSLATSTHARRNVDSPKLSRGKQALLPPTRTKVSTQSRYHFDAPSKVLNLTSGGSMRKSRSEGNFGVL